MSDTPTPASELKTLPAVAKSIFIMCKKCGADRYHTVIAHKTATSAKVKCEICGAQSTFALPKEGKPKKVGTGKARTPSASARAQNHQDEYQKLLGESKTDKQSYNMKMTFVVKQKLDHPKFGLGVIRSVLPEKIEVVFPDEVRSLIHNRR